MICLTHNKKFNIMKGCPDCIKENDEYLDRSWKN